MLDSKNVILVFSLVPLPNNGCTQMTTTKKGNLCGDAIRSVMPH